MFNYTNSFYKPISIILVFTFIVPCFGQSQDLSIELEQGVTIPFLELKPLLLSKLEGHDPFLVMRVGDYSKKNEQKKEIIIVNYENGDIDLENAWSLEKTDDHYSFYDNFWQDPQYWYMLGNEKRKQNDGVDLTIYQYDYTGSLVKEIPILHWYKGGKLSNLKEFNPNGAKLWTTFNKDSSFIASVSTDHDFARPGKFRINVGFANLKTLETWQQKIDMKDRDMKGYEVLLTYPIEATNEVAVFFRANDKTHKRHYRISFFSSNGTIRTIYLNLPKLKYDKRKVVDWIEDEEGNLHLIYLGQIREYQFHSFNQKVINPIEGKIKAEYELVFTDERFSNLATNISPFKEYGPTFNGKYLDVLKHNNNEFSFIYHADSDDFQKFRSQYEVIRFNTQGELIWANTFPHFSVNHWDDPKFATPVIKNLGSDFLLITNILLAN